MREVEVEAQLGDRLRVADRAQQVLGDPPAVGLDHEGDVLRAAALDEAAQQCLRLGLGREVARHVRVEIHGPEPLRRGDPRVRVLDARRAELHTDTQPVLLRQPPPALDLLVAGAADPDVEGVEPGLLDLLQHPVLGPRLGGGRVVAQAPQVLDDQEPRRAVLAVVAVEAARLGRREAGAEAERKGQESGGRPRRNRAHGHLRSRALGGYRLSWARARMRVDQIFGRP